MNFFYTYTFFWKPQKLLLAVPLQYRLLCISMNTSLALCITVFHTKKGEEKGSMTFIKYLEAHLLLNEVAFIEIKVNSSNAYHAKVTVHFVLYHITFITKSRNKNLLTLLYNRLSISDEEKNVLALLSYTHRVQPHQKAT